MQCLAWDKRLTEENCPQYYSSNPLSPFSWPQQPMPLYVLKYKGLVQSSCIPSLPEVSLLKVTDRDLVLKLTPTGVTFLGHYNEETKSYEATGRFRKRYTGSKTCAVDPNGKLWLDAAELDSTFKQPKDKGKKKSAGVPPSAQKLFELPNPGDLFPGQAAISQENANYENISTQFAQNVAKKSRKKAYKVDKAKARQRILAMTNTQKGKKSLFFWTVSFPEHTPDDICYQAFNTWLTSLRQRKMIKDYLWIAERQTGERLKSDKAPTNTIHFHIAIPHFMNVQRANAMMRTTLKTLARRGSMPGAVCDHKTDAVYFLPCVAKYNGVDICKHRKTKRVINFALKKGSSSLANYLTKYITKNDSEFPHLAWHNSRGFSCLFTGITCTLDEFKKAGFGGYLNRVRLFKMNFAVFQPWLYGPPKAVMDHLFTLNSTIQKLFDDGT
jgi:hypothetical protein